MNRLRRFVLTELAALTWHHIPPYCHLSEGGLQAAEFRWAAHSNRIHHDSWHGRRMYHVACSLL
jgi:hypothetical protein